MHPNDKTEKRFSKATGIGFPTLLNFFAMKKLFIAKRGKGKGEGEEKEEKWGISQYRFFDGYFFGLQKA